MQREDETFLRLKGLRYCPVCEHNKTALNKTPVICFCKDGVVPEYEFHCLVSDMEIVKNEVNNRNKKRFK